MERNSKQKVSSNLSVLSFLQPSLKGILLLVIFIASIAPVKSRDIFWHLRTGKYVAMEHSIPQTDPFSYTMKGEPWRAHEALSDILFFIIEKNFGGIRALVLLKAIMFTLIFWILFSLSARENRELPAFFLILLGGIVCLPSFIIRPQIFTYFFFVVTYYSLERFPQRKLLYFYPLLIFFWSYLHGAFIFGQFLFAVYFTAKVFEYWQEKRQSKVLTENLVVLKKLFWIGFFAFITPLANPNFYKVYTYPLNYMGKNLHKIFIYEWYPPNFQEELPTEIFLLLLIACLLFISRRKLLKFSILLFPFTHLALQSARNIPFWVFLSIPIMVSVFPEVSVKVKEDRKAVKQTSSVFKAWLNERILNMNRVSRQGSVFLPIIFIIVSSYFLINSPPFPNNKGESQWLNPKIFPLKAVLKLKSLPSPSPLFNSYDWGGYILWKTNIPVFIDGRADLYIPKLFSLYFKVVQPKDNTWKTVLNRRHIKTIIIEKKSYLAELLRLNPNWKDIYNDNLAVIFQRKK